ncbi:DUF1572 domain-containing protein [Flavobacterium azooxidireducens]|uniref:DUF1572 domain-containing protein n=1 Tax=Flavobacterium azooxidireducens TaxID=1871076 RepID=A0ABY4KFI1_9FLAO|nr:DUF1572 domain-containing protein [Flavobacterium azooxidireducens]UPQ79459.1 DUF1572 domain-containing protein [Flavobacterium azooxidireducens]
MKTPHQLASRFREVILNGTWVANTNFKAQLSGTDYKTVTTALSDLNTIAVLAQHIRYYINGINQVFKGGPLAIKDKYSFDFPPITSQEQWENFLDTFWNDSEIFANYVEQLSEEQLQHYFTDEKYGTYYRNIDGMIEHSYYHLGQIVLIKKLISANKK